MFHLYRHFDADRILLYVGQSCCAICRLRGHRNSDWHGSIAGVTIEHYATLADVLAAEQAAIQNENPKFNVSGSKFSSLERYEIRNEIRAAEKERRRQEKLAAEAAAAERKLAQTKALCRENTKRLWLDPEFRARQAEAVRQRQRRLAALRGVES